MLNNLKKNPFLHDRFKIELCAKLLNVDDIVFQLDNGDLKLVFCLFHLCNAIIQLAYIYWCHVMFNITLFVCFMKDHVRYGIQHISEYFLIFYPYIYKHGDLKYKSMANM